MAFVAAIPKMTSNTAPSGVASASSTLGAAFAAWQAFNQTDCNLSSMQGGWLATAADNTPTLSYEFATPQRIDSMWMKTANNGPSRTHTVYVEGLISGSWTNILKDADSLSVTFAQGAFSELTADCNGETCSAVRIRGIVRWYEGVNLSASTVSQLQFYYDDNPTPPPPVWGFNLELQRNDSEPIKLDKTLTAVQTLAGVLRDDCSIENPVFTVEAPLSLLAGCNYVTIPEFGRSYFITDTISVSNELTAIYCRVDVLSSFKAGIRQNKGIVHRQENRWNLYLNDGSLKAYQNPLVDTIVFPQGFSGQSYVLITSGFHGGGNSIGSPSDVSIYDEDPSGAGNVYSKTTAGLLAYAQAQLGKPYWFGTFGNIADQALLDAKRYQYPAQYPASHDFTADFTKRVHDCVGIVKGYRWSETPTSTPVYNASQDVDCTGLLYQCTGNSNRWGPISGTTTGIPVGAVLFNVVSRPDGSMTSSHCGVFSGTGKVIEARGRDYGVVESNLSDRPGFNYWGIPSWLQISTPRQTIV